MWTYEQATGHLSHDGELIGTGYAGHGVGRNHPEMESVASVGPLPCGVYTIGPAFTHPKTGPLTMRLFPDADNQMFGRSGFLMHGDNPTHTASEGCIVIGRMVRQQVAASVDRRLQVVICPPFMPPPVHTSQGVTTSLGMVFYAQ